MKFSMGGKHAWTIDGEGAIVIGEGESSMIDVSGMTDGGLIANWAFYAPAGLRFWARVRLVWLVAQRIFRQPYKPIVLTPAVKTESDGESE